MGKEELGPTGMGLRLRQAACALPTAAGPVRCQASVTSAYAGRALPLVAGLGPHHAGFAGKSPSPQRR